MASIKVVAPVHAQQLSSAISLTYSGSVAIGSDGTYTIDPRDLREAMQKSCWLHTANVVIEPSNGGTPSPSLQPLGLSAPLVGQRCVVGSLIGANVNTTGDNIIPISKAAKFIPAGVIVTNASTSLSAAYGGLYTAVSKGGTNLVAQAALSSLSASTKFISHTLANNTDVLTSSNLYYSCGTVQGGTATADIYVIGDVIA